jgi:hypothetical protein
MKTAWRPLARTEDVVVEYLGTDLVVYDQRSNLASVLNRTAALVWENADGERTVADLAAVVEAELGDVADEDLVLVSLDRLYERGLIDSGYEGRAAEDSRQSRRRFIRRAGVVGAAALALPVIQSIVLPMPSAASSSR